MSLRSRLRRLLSIACALGLLATLFVVAPTSAQVPADPTHGKLTLAPDHGPCTADITFRGSGFIPGQTVILRTLDTARGQVLDGEPVYQTTADSNGEFTYVAKPCADSNVRSLFWSAEPPGRPHFVTPGAVGMALFNVYDPASSQYFPETNQTVSGEFLYYWQQFMLLRNAGFPITPAEIMLNRDGDTVLTQYFERQRFELHENLRNTPYYVLLGRLGAELLEQQGRDWRAFPKGDPSQPFYFPETGHAIMYEFTGFWLAGDWRLSASEDGTGNPAAGLAMYGYPLSEPMLETNADGDTVLTQYFERAVFEWHPDNPEQYRILLRRVGAELLGLDRTPPDAELPAAGICAAATGAVVTITLHPDVPDPRCVTALPEQRLTVVNALNHQVAVIVGPYVANLAPGEQHEFSRSVGSFLAPGVHRVQVVGGYAAELWVQAAD